MDPALAARLAQLDSDFKAASTDDDRFALPEPGDYQCILKEIDTFEGTADKTQYLKLVFEIALGDQAGRTIDKVYSWLPDERMDAETAAKRLGFFKKDLSTLGVDVNSDEFSYTQVYPGAPMWDELMDVPVEIAVVDSKKINPETNKPYRNAYLNERLGDAMPGGFTPKSDVPSSVGSFGAPVSMADRAKQFGDDVPWSDDRSVPDEDGIKF